MSSEFRKRGYQQSIFLETTVEPMAPVTQPWKAAENFPASEPATTMWMYLPSANFGVGVASISAVILAAEATGMPAPETSLDTISLRGREVTSWMRARSRSLG